MISGGRFDACPPLQDPHAVAAVQRAGHPLTFAAIRGLSHQSFAADAPPSSTLAAIDLTPDIPSAHAAKTIAALVTDFATTASQGVMASKGPLREAEQEAVRLAKPIVDALKLEGSVSG